MQRELQLAAEAANKDPLENRDPLATNGADYDIFENVTEWTEVVDNDNEDDTPQHWEERIKEDNPFNINKRKKTTPPVRKAPVNNWFGLSDSSEDSDDDNWTNVGEEK